MPAEKGRNYIELTAVFLSLCVGIPPLLLGSALVARMGLEKAIAATFWGCVLATPICLLASHVGTRSRLSTGMTLKFAFGGVGAKVISAIIAVDMLCWFAMNTEIFGTSLKYTAASILGTNLNKLAFCALAGVLMTVLTIFGYRSLEKFAFLVVPVFALVLFTYLIYALAKSSFSEVLARQALTQRMSFATAISIVAGSFINISVLLPDYTRYSKSGWHAATAVIFGLCLGVPLFVLVACYLTAVTGEQDFVKVMLLQGWGLAAILIVALACWFHMNACLYSASLNLAAITRRAAKWKLTVFAGLVGTTVALFGIVSRYVPFLIILSVVVPPITGVYTADYLLRRGLYQSAYLSRFNHFRPLALGALIAGVAVGFMTARRDDMGFGLFSLTYLPAIDSFLVSFVTQWALGKLVFLRAERGSETIESA